MLLFIALLAPAKKQDGGLHAVVATPPPVVVDRNTYKMNESACQMNKSHNNSAATPTHRQNSLNTYLPNIIIHTICVTGCCVLSAGGIHHAACMLPYHLPPTILPALPSLRHPLNFAFCILQRKNSRQVQPRRCLRGRLPPARKIVNRVTPLLSLVASAGSLGGGHLFVKNAGLDSSLVRPKKNATDYLPCAKAIVHFSK